MKKKILFAASEAVPFIKTGGLADVVGSLPKCFDKEEYDVRVVLPKYACMSEEWKSLLEYRFHFVMDLNWRKQYVGVLEYKYEGVTFYFIDNEFYFSGPKPYTDFNYDAEKFAYFSKAVLCMLPKLDYQPDIIHCHDWQTGLVPVFLDSLRQKDDFYLNIKTIITIHNLRFQGMCDINRAKDITGLADSYFTSDKLEAYGCANFLKGGIVYADKITTVSNSYAEEIKTAFYGERLDGLMNARADSLVGIVNGIDYTEYNPGTDEVIAKKYTVDTFRREKKKNKVALQEKLGLTVDSRKMMLGIVSRLTDQKGLDLVNYMMDELCGDDIQIVILGTGEARYENSFRYFAEKYPDKVSAQIYYSETMSHKIYAACDGYLMPSLFEPCGLSQLISLRYGTIPIVRETGGLTDTVEAYNEYEQTGTGFRFTNYNAHEMLSAIRYAERIFYDKKKDWNKIVERAMKKDFSWRNSAVLYQKIYDNL